MTADHGLESKHRALWALGDYTTVATEVVAPLGSVLVQESGIGAGDGCSTSLPGQAMWRFPPRSPAPM